MSPTSCQTAPPRARRDKDCSVLRCAMSTKLCGYRLELLRVAASGLPNEQASLGQRHAPVEKERKRRQYEDSREHGIDIEGAFRLQDEVADAPRRAEILADHGADECEPDRIVQARENPAHGAWHIDVAQELSLACAEDAGVGEDRMADLPHTLIDIEEHDKEHQRHAQSDFGSDVQAEPDAEDRRQDHAGHRIERLDVRIEQRGGHWTERQPQADAEAERSAERERERRLHQRHPEVRVNRPRREPRPGALQHLERLAEEKRSLVGIVEIDRRKQRRTGSDVPKHHDAQEEQCLPEVQESIASAGHSSSALRTSWRARSACEARRSAASAAPPPRRAAWTDR